MMLKSKPGKNRRMRVLALAPAAALALLVTNHPVIASGLSTVGQASLTPAATADGKGSEKSVNSNQTSPDVNDINEVVYIGRDDAGDNSEAPNQSMRIDGKSDSSVKYSVTIDGEKFEGDLNTIPSDKVVGIDVIKSDSGSVINITTKKPGDSSSNVAAAVQKMPQFPGGEKAMLQWLREHIQYPAEIKPADMPEKVRVIVKFVVDEDGRAINPEIMRGASAPFNREALKVIGEMPLWSPGTLNGKPTAVHYTLPVNFKKPSN